MNASVIVVPTLYLGLTLYALRYVVSSITDRRDREFVTAIGPYVAASVTFLTAAFAWEQGWIILVGIPAATLVASLYLMSRFIEGSHQ